MTDKEFRRLSRGELVEIIYELQKNEQELKDANNALKEENAELKKSLESREIKLSEVGSIAEATVELSGIFEVAQNAADEFLAKVKADNADVEIRCSKMLSDAEEEAAQIVQNANSQAEEKWSEFKEKADAFMRAHDALKKFLDD